MPIRNPSSITFRLETRDQVTDVKRFPMKLSKFATQFKGNVAASSWKDEWG